MSITKDPHVVPLEQVLAFLRTTLPFQDLDNERLRRFAHQCLIDFFAKGTLVLQQGLTKASHFYLIQKGGVRIFYEDADGDIVLKDFRGEGQYFGAVPLIRDSKTSDCNVETVEDTFCFLFPKKAFLELVDTSPGVSRFFLRSMTDKLITSAYSEQRRHKMAPRTESALQLISLPAGDICKGPPLTIAPGDSAQQAAQVMSANHIGSLLVGDEAGEVIGIVTDKDLRTKIVAKGRDYTTPVREIMSTPVQTIPGQTVCFDALLTMMAHHIHHLAVTRQGKISGIITAHDIMVQQGSSPMYLFREILAQQHLEGLHKLAPKVPFIIRGLVEEGAKADHIARMITLLNDHILDKILTILIEKLGPPPLPFCWMYMGSEGRKEQTFKTDQDNAIVYQDPATAAEAAAAAAYFQALGEAAIVQLTACGFPPCPGNIMASNPQWRQPFSVWRGYFADWIHKPDPQEIRNSTIFFDFRAGFGTQTLVTGLREELNLLARRQDLFFFHLAGDCLESRAPLSFFRNFIVEKDGEHKNHLDIKKRGLVPFVDFSRLMALHHGISATNTLDRLRQLAEFHHIPTELFTETAQAYEFLMQLRLLQQLHLLEKGKEPDNHIDPADLTDLEKQTLKEAFAVIGRLQSFIRQEFHLERS